MPRKPQSEKSNEFQMERPATRRSVRLSASSVVSPEPPQSHGNGNFTKPPVNPVSPPKTSRASSSGRKSAEIKHVSSSKTTSHSRTKVENEILKEEAKAAEEPTDKDSVAAQKKRGRRPKGKGDATNAKDAEAEAKKESKKDNIEAAKDAKQRIVEENKTEQTSTEKRRRGRSIVTPASEKTSLPRRCGNGHGKDRTETEEPAEAVSTLCHGIKRKREDDAKEIEQVGNPPKKQKTENLEVENVGTVVVDAQAIEKFKDIREERIIKISEKTEQEPNKLSDDPKTSECEKTNLDEKTRSGEKHFASDTAADVRENGLGLVHEVMMKSNSFAVAFGLGATAAKAGQETTSSSDNISDVISDGTSDALCSRKFVWFQGNELSESDSLRSFSVVSYNILADCHAQRDYAQPGSWIAKDHLSIDYRHALLMKEIRFLSGDILCFQEVGTDYFTSMLKPALAELGYDGLYVPRNTTVYSEGEATFFRTKFFKLESSQSLILSQVAKMEIDESGIEPDVKKSVKEAVESYAVALLMRLRCLNSEATVTCANIHVAYDKFERQDKQCLQLACTIRELVKFAGGPDKPHFICGDFNSWPDSPPYQLVRDGHLSEKSLAALQSINTVSQSDGQLAPLVNYWSEGFQYSPANNLQSAYMEVLKKEPLTSRFHVDGVVRSVDYIWFSNNTLQVKGVLETVDEEKIKDGVPNIVFPSDHLSLKAVFSFK